MGEAPFGIVRHREGLTVKRSMRILRFWRNKETGAVVEVRKLQQVVPEGTYRIVFFDPQVGIEVAMPFDKPKKNPFQPPGVVTPLMEDCFTNQFEPYSNFTSRA